MRPMASCAAAVVQKITAMVRPDISKTGTWAWTAYGAVMNVGSLTSEVTAMGLPPLGGYIQGIRRCRLVYT